MAADVSRLPAIVVLLAYGLVYWLTCVGLLLVGALRGDQVRDRLRRVCDRIGRARTVPRSIPAAVLLLAAAVGVAGVAATA